MFKEARLACTSNCACVKTLWPEDLVQDALERSVVVADLIKKLADHVEARECPAVTEIGVVVADLGQVHSRVEETSSILQLMLIPRSLWLIGRTTGLRRKHNLLAPRLQGLAGGT